MRRTFWDVLRGEFLRHGSRDAQPRRSARHSGPTGPSDIVLHSPAGPEERSRGSALYALPPPGTSESERTEDGDTDSDAAPVIRTSRTALALAAVAHGTSPGSACRRAVRLVRHIGVESDSWDLDPRHDSDVTV